jgi:hypothetical protein
MAEKHLSDAGVAYANPPHFGPSGGIDDSYRRGGAGRPSSVVTGVHSADSNQQPQQQQQQQQQPSHPPPPQQQQQQQQTLPRLLMVQSAENASRRGGRSSPLPQAVQGAQPQVSGPAGEPGIRSEFGKMFSGIGSGVGGSSGSPLAATGQSANIGMGGAAAAADGDGSHQAMQPALHGQSPKESENGNVGGSAGAGTHAGHGNEDGGTAANAAAAVAGPNAGASVASSYENSNGLPNALERPHQIMPPLRGTKRPKKPKDSKGTPNSSAAVVDGGDGRAGADQTGGGRDAKKSKLSASGMTATPASSTPTAAGGRMGGSSTLANLSSTMHHHHHHHHHQSISPGLRYVDSALLCSSTRDISYGKTRQLFFCVSGIPCLPTNI